MLSNDGDAGLVSHGAGSDRAVPWWRVRLFPQLVWENA
jgi:hypothetical protein